MLAYSSISQAGYILIGLSVGGGIGLAAAVLYSVVNALNKTLLFLSTGIRGRGAATAFVIGAFSVAGLPPAVGFFGKIALFQSGIEADSLVFISLVLLGSALAFVYMFQTFQRSFWANAVAQNASVFSSRMLVVWVAAGMVLFFGLWPRDLISAARLAAFSLTGDLP